VTWRGELVAYKGFGRFTYEADAPEMAVETVFDLASVTKIVATAPMAMILYERGLLDLEMPVQSVLPQFAGPDPRREKVTIRLLLAHTSGLPGYVKLFETARTREELVQRACQTPLESDPGERSEYSDIGFVVLGEALARLADEPLNEFCRREIFGPLRMTNATFNPPAAWRASIPPTEHDQVFRHRVIQGEVNDENASVMGGVAGHAGLFAPALDLARFACALLDQGRPLVRPETLRVFGERQSANGRALGFDVPTAPSQSGKYFSARSLGHLGYTGTSLWMDPERDLSITLLTNRTWPDRRSQEIKRVRPAVHDAVTEELGVRS
jgi:CubicO group peptidase (beta-lactamase class C family)